MNHHHAPFESASPRQRLWLAGAAFTVTASVFSALLLNFHASSPAIWLTPTPELMARLSGCDERPSREGQVRCKQQLVAQRLAPDPQPLQLARR